jgi:hypothetical protein
MMVLHFEHSPQFAKDLKTLTKKWRSIPHDLDKAKLAITPLYIPIAGVDMEELRDSFFATKRATILQSDENYEVVKMRFDCAALRSDRKTRLVFVSFVKGSTITFVELYNKAENPREDPKRYTLYL